MKIFRAITKSNFVIRLRSWEYWPFGIIQLPVFIYWLYLSLKARSLLFFSASNPGIPMGGMFGESKFAIIRQLAPDVTPRTVLVARDSNPQEVADLLTFHGLSYPLIFKPDLGERGFMVKRITNAEEATKYALKSKGDFLIQELIDLPLEFGVLYRKYPGSERGEVISIVAKEMLSVTGDGSSTLRDLILSLDRARLQWKKLRISFADRLESIPAKGETIELVSIGNHAQGTKFLDGSHLINDQLSQSFDRIAGQIPGFFFGRFDVRCASVRDLNEGNVKIMELNGCGAEPAHIYDPEYGPLNAIKVLLDHWHTLYEVSRENHRRGIPYISFTDAYRYYRKFRKLVG